MKILIFLLLLLLPLSLAQHDETTEMQLLAQMEQMSVHMQQMSSQMQAQTQQIDHLSSKVQQLQDQIEHYQSFNASFSAYMTKGLHHTSQVWEILPFDATEVNVGGHFDTDTHIFTCPLTGVYVFSFSIYSERIGGNSSHSLTTAMLLLDGVVMAEVYSRETDPAYHSYAQAATTMLVECPQGSLVFVAKSFPKHTSLRHSDRKNVSVHRVSSPCCLTLEHQKQ